MKRTTLVFLSASLVASGGPRVAAAAEGELLISLTGLDYQNPNFSGTYLDLGEGYNVLGFVATAGPMLAPYIHFSSYEYTIYIRDLWVSERFFYFPTLMVKFDDNARWSYYADDFRANGGTNAAYGLNPPNGTAPSHFIDAGPSVLTGERVTGDLDHFLLLYNYSTNQGSFYGDLTLDGGADLIYVPPAKRAGWVLSGPIWLDSRNLPPIGYDHTMSAECRMPGTTGVRLPQPSPPSGMPARLTFTAPNPFMHDVTVGLSLATRTRVALGIYDVGGRMVRCLMDDVEQEPGDHVVRWDGLDSRDRPLPSGLYYVMLQVKDGGRSMVRIVKLH